MILFHPLEMFCASSPLPSTQEAFGPNFLIYSKAHRKDQYVAPPIHFFRIIFVLIAIGGFQFLRIRRRIVLTNDDRTSLNESPVPRRYLPPSRQLPPSRELPQRRLQRYRYQQNEMNEFETPNQVEVERTVHEREAYERPSRAWEDGLPKTLDIRPADTTDMLDQRIRDSSLDQSTKVSDEL